MANSLSVIGLSLVSISASAQLLFYDAIIVDELGLGGYQTKPLRKRPLEKVNKQKLTTCQTHPK